MKLKGLIWRVLLLFIILPPPSHPASSDSFPWSGDPNARPGLIESGVHKDAYGALRDNAMLPDTLSSSPSSNQPASNRVSGIETGAIVPGGTVSSSGIAQGNIGPTQSGPGAAGLFTPNNPGNAAAYNAQVSAGLVGAPIVDGNGVNMRITVPTSTPSGTINYQNVGTRSANTGNTNTAKTVNIANGDSERVTGKEFRTYGRQTGNGWTNAQSFNALIYKKRRGAPGAMLLSRRSPIMPTGITGGGKQFTYPRLSKTEADSAWLAQLGQLTGSITYDDGAKVLLGTNGSAAVDPHGIVQMPDGKRMPMKSLAGALRQIAQKNQVHL